MEQACSNIAVQRIVDDHTNYMVRARTKCKMDGEISEHGFASKRKRLYELLYEYPNMGDYMGWIGLSPPTTYPSIVEHHHIRRFPYTRAPHLCIKKQHNPSRPPTLRIDKHRTWANPKER